MLSLITIRQIGADAENAYFTRNLFGLKISFMVTFMIFESMFTFSGVFE